MLRRRHAAAFLLLALAVRNPAKADDASLQFPQPPPRDPANLGVGVQRTMTLLATSTPERRNSVRILFYGQSITEQDWSKRVADDLRRRFPQADLLIENRAIGGFASQRLIYPAEHDLYPFDPDLLIFHVYGSNQEYERIIRETRSRTAAEVLMQTDHLTRWPPEPIDESEDKGAWWDDLMNRKFLPEIAARYRCGLADVRGGWVDYLKANDLDPKDLLRDGVHLNDYGNDLMAELVKRHLVHRPELPDAGWKDLVTTHDVGGDLRWEGGLLALEFEGNAVEVLPSGAGGGPADIRVDGKKPTEFPGVFAISRPQPGPWSPLALTRVDKGDDPVGEGWTLTVNEVGPESKAWRFAVSGSVTGPDGGGSSDAPFVSDSGRVRIDPAAWFRNGEIPVGYEITWQVAPQAVDTYTPPASFDPAREGATTLARGLPNGRHRLELRAVGDEPPPIRAIRVRRPPVR